MVAVVTYHMFRAIMDSIFGALSRNDLIPLRRVTKEWRRRIDQLLARHLVLSTEKVAAKRKLRAEMRRQALRTIHGSLPL